MAETFLENTPELHKFVLPNIRLTGTIIGYGAHGSVEEVAIPGAICAAKTVLYFLQDKARTPAAVTRDAAERFVRECQLMSTLCHPNIVKFLGIAFLPKSELPALVMERMLTSLHDILDPETDTPPPHGVSKLFLPLTLKCSILQDVASGLAYLHQKFPPVIHRDLSAKNVLLNSDMVAKISDMGMACTLKSIREALTMSGYPGSQVYMPPEAMVPSNCVYDGSIDIFSFGIIAMFTISEMFPCDPLPPNYADLTTGLLVARTEFERRREYIKQVHDQLSLCGHYHEEHPLIRLMQQCLHNIPAKRPGVDEVLGMLEEARSAFGDDQRYKRDSGLTGDKNQSLEGILQDSVQENAHLQSRVQELQLSNVAKGQELVETQQKLNEKEEQLRNSEGEKEALKNQLRENKESMKREESCVQEIEQQAAGLLQSQKEEKEPSTNLPSYVCHVTGPGLTSATVGQPTHILLELINNECKPYSQKVLVTAQLQKTTTSSPPLTTPTSTTQLSSEKQSEANVSVVMVSHSQYKVSYTIFTRGQYQLHVHINEKEINDSPFTLTAYLDPTLLSCPVRVMTNLDKPYSIAYRSDKTVIISECSGHRLSVINVKGHKTLLFGSDGEQVEIKAPAGLAVDDCDNVYVTSCHKLQKFCSNGKLIKCIGQKGNEEGQFNDPAGLTVYNDNIFVCDRNNHRIQVFDNDLNFVRSFGSLGNEGGKFDSPIDVTFDTEEHMYVADCGNSRVQVLDTSGQFIRVLGDESEDNATRPSGLHLCNNYVYVSDWSGNRIVVYRTSGQFVTTFGSAGDQEGEFYSPYSITSDPDGFIYVCDCCNDRVQIF